MVQNQAAEEVFERISALQAEVERMRIEDEERRLACQEIEQENELLRDERAELVERHEAEKDALRRQHSQLTDHWKEQLRLKEQDVNASSPSKVSSLRAKFEPAVQELATVKAEAESSRIAADERINALEKDLHATRKQLNGLQDAEAARKAAEDMNKALVKELQVARDETRRYQSQIESNQEANAATIKDLSAELETKNNEIALERKESIHRSNEAVSLTESIEQRDQELRGLESDFKAVQMELDHAHKQLAESRRIVETIEDENDRLVQQNDRQAQDIAELEEGIRSQEVDKTIPRLSDEQRDGPAAEHGESNNIDEAGHKAAL